MSDNRSKEFSLRHIVRAIPEVTSWQVLGLHLDVPRHKVEEIQLCHPYNITQCKIALISHWLDNDEKASWKKLADALDQEYRSLAARIRKNYVLSTGKGAEKSRTPSPAFHSGTNPFSFSPVVVRQPSVQQLPHDNEIENKRQLSEMDSRSILFQCLFCGSFQSIEKTSDITKAPKRRYVELLQKPLPHGKMLQYLLQGNLDAFYVGEEGRTLLHFAAIHCSVESLKTLVAYRGPDVNPFSAQGTPMDLAGVNIHSEEVNALLKSVGGQSYSTLSRKQLTIKLPKSQGSRMCVLNSSGLSAILHIEALQQLERGSGRKVFEIFDWVVATGLSALFLLLMVYGHKSLADVRRLYFKLHQSVLAHKPCSRALEEFLKAHLAPEVKMNSAKEPKILLPAMCKTATGKVQIHIFNNCLQDRFSEIPVWKVARYLVSHPPHVPQLDGYLSQRDSAAHINICGLGLRRARQYHRESGEREDRIGRVVRLEPGQFDNHHPQLLDPITAEEDVKDGKCFVLNPVLPCPLFLSLSVDDADVVDCVIETMKQVSCKLDSLVSFLS